MISVPNRQRPLNGNRLFACIWIAGVLTSLGCSSLKPAQNRPATSDHPPQKTETAPQVYNPRTGKYEPVEDPGKLVDTIRFQENTEVTPIGQEGSKVYGRKDVYDIAFLIPFNAEKTTSLDQGIDPKVRRFLHYYGGVKMALEDLDASGVHLSARIYDTQESAETAKQYLRTLRNVDVVVGPYETESLADAAAFSSQTKIPVFSPWTPTIPLDADFPSFVQLTPGLEAHAEALVKYIDANLSGAKVYMVARDDVREKNRLNLFREVHDKSGTGAPYEELIIKHTSASLDSTKLEGILTDQDTTVFIIPYYSRNDEDFVNAILRKLHAEQGTGVAYVFGMPQWLTFNRLNPDYLESAHAHISTAYFMDPSDPEVLKFERRFFSEYSALPEPAAYQGFTFVHFLGDALQRYGSGFLDMLSDRFVTTGTAEFDLVPVYRNPVQETQNVPNYLENRAIQILEFRDLAFHRIQ